MAVLTHKSLKAQKHNLSESSKQIDLIQNSGLRRFEDQMKDIDLFPLKPVSVDTFQINLGKMCNQVCNHCHVDAGPDRKEIMTRETMEFCLNAIRHSNCTTVDLTGGAPEMNPNFEWFVKELRALGKHVIVRCNLTIILANKKYHHLPEFYRKNEVEIISSLPCYTESNTDSQRGKGVFQQSIKALKMLNREGYGKDDTGLILNLVYNPGGPSLPGDQASLQKDYKKVLLSEYGIAFNQLFTITNLPINRFLEFLLASENYDMYMEKLVNSFNPDAAENVMCRSMVSVGWDGYLYDCDFNQMLDLKIRTDRQHIAEFDQSTTQEREIIVNQHCYGCTAGAGSSCSGTTI